MTKNIGDFIYKLAGTEKSSFGCFYIGFLQDLINRGSRVTNKILGLRAEAVPPPPPPPPPLGILTLPLQYPHPTWRTPTPAPPVGHPVTNNAVLHITQNQDTIDYTLRRPADSRQKGRAPKDQFPLCYFISFKRKPVFFFLLKPCQCPPVRTVKFLSDFLGWKKL